MGLQITKTLAGTTALACVLISGLAGCDSGNERLQTQTMPEQEVGYAHTLTQTVDILSHQIIDDRAYLFLGECGFMVPHGTTVSRTGEVFDSAGQLRAQSGEETVGGSSIEEIFEQLVPWWGEGPEVPCFVTLFAWEDS